MRQTKSWGAFSSVLCCLGFFIYQGNICILQILIHLMLLFIGGLFIQNGHQNIGIPWNGRKITWMRFLRFSSFQQLSGRLCILHAVEFLNSTYRRLNQQRRVFPSDTALYLLPLKPPKEGLRPPGTGLRSDELSIMYEGRLPD